MSKTAQINMRVEPAQQALLSRAAQIQNLDRTTFIINAACEKAKQVLMDQNFFQLNDEQFEVFNMALNEPIAQSDKLKALLKEPSPWER